MYQPRPDPAFSRTRSTPSASSVMARHLSEQIHEPIDVEGPASEPVLTPPEPRYRPQPPVRRQEMDWASWAIRSQQTQERLATGLERLIWGGVGALSGAAAGGVPAVIDTIRAGYPFVFSQSLGAAVGAVGAILALQWFHSHPKVERRRRVEPQDHWTSERQEASWR